MSWPEVSGVTMHSERYGDAHPAVNVKVYETRGFDGARAELVSRGFSEKVAEESVEAAYDANCDLFWEQAQDDAEFCLTKNRHTERRAWYGFSPGLKVYQEGRSGGWLVVEGLPHPKEWNKAQRIRWERFEKCINANVVYWTSKDGLLETCELNEIPDRIQRRHEIDAKVDAYRKKLEATL